MMQSDDEINVLTEAIIGCAIEVHKTLGPGLLESVYRECLSPNSGKLASDSRSTAKCLSKYKGKRIRGKLLIDLLVDERVVVELKAVESLRPVYLTQVITYLKLTGSPVGLLINFNETTLRAGLRRLDHPDRYIRGNRSGG